MTIKSIITKSLICSATALATVGSASAQGQGVLYPHNPGEDNYQQNFGVTKQADPCAYVQALKDLPSPNLVAAIKAVTGFTEDVIRNCLKSDPVTD